MQLDLTEATGAGNEYHPIQSYILMGVMEICGLSQVVPIQSRDIDFFVLPHAAKLARHS